MKLKEDELDSTRASTDKLLRERQEIFTFFQNKIDDVARSLPEVSTGQEAESKMQCVILARTIDTLGSYLLDDLVARLSVQYIYWLKSAAEWP